MNRKYNSTVYWVWNSYNIIQKYWNKYIYKYNTSNSTMQIPIKYFQTKHFGLKK